MNDDGNVKWIGVALVNAAIAAWLIYSIATSNEPPGETVTLLKYLLAAGCLFGAGRAVFKLMAKR